MSSPTHIPAGNPCSICGKPALSHRPSHNPKGDPCTTCGLPAERHRVKHEPQGDPCACGVPMSGHIGRTRSSEEMGKRAHRSRTKPRKPYSQQKKHFIGIDGEGQGKEITLPDGRKARHDHRYVLLGASDENGDRQWHTENINGLTTEECLNFLLTLPHERTKFFMYGNNYDITKMLEDVDNERLYILFRPEHPKRRRRWKERRKGPKYVRWRGYDLNLQATKFTVRRGKKKIVIWDLLKFYQSKFVGALEKWKIGEPDRIEFMKYMKEHRNEFDKIHKVQVRTYCLDECRYIAELAHSLVDAHTKAGLKLTSFYGAGSSSGAMLKVMNIQEQIPPCPDYMRNAVAMAFFGGRFEHSVIGEEWGAEWQANQKTGEWERPLYAYDLSSAYPYQLYLLPCLMHARWDWVTARKDLEGAQHALVQYNLPPSGNRSRTKGGAIQLHQPWGPYPFRLEDGSIAFPSTSGGGYVWLAEYLAGERLFPHVKFEGAWVYRSECTCHPFKRIADFYLERLRIDKEGPGIVLKLGMNGGYGKLAQSVGAAPFNCWIWAGITTSGTRAQLLDGLGCHRDWNNMLLTATDGIVSRERLTLPKPKETGTDIDVTTIKGEVVRKPLGGWEEKILTKGMFLARPGIYFPTTFSEQKEEREKEIEKCRGRGVGRKVIFEAHQNVIQAWNDNPSAMTTVKVQNVDRFCGAKSSISHSKDGYNRASGNPLDGEVCYGQWITRPVTMTFNPMPKRESILPDGRSLKLRSFPTSQKSVAYKRALKDAETVALMTYQEMMLEQPDGDFAEDYVFD